MLYYGTTIHRNIYTTNLIKRELYKSGHLRLTDTFFHFPENILMQSETKQKISDEQ